MLKQLNKTILLTLIALFFALPAVYAEPAPDVQNSEVQNEQMNPPRKDVKVNDLDIEPMNTRKLKKEVIPDVEKEGRKVIGLFLKTMMAVILSAVLLYFILLFVRKFHGNKYIPNSDEEFAEFDLAPANNKDDALKSFLKRTGL